NNVILSDVVAIRGEASILTFRRAAAKVGAEHPDGEVVNIALSGDIGAYLGGVRCLTAAIQSLRKSGSNYNIVYVGPQKRNLRRSGIMSYDFISATGFI